MGVFEVLSLVVGATQTAVSVAQASKARKARREANAVAGANEESKNRIARREAAKRQRIQRARIAQSASTSGVGGSSGELGAISALGSSTGSSVAQQRSDVLAAKGIGAASTREANAISRANSAQAWGGLFNEVLGFANDEGLFG